jgi:hypothetical protein
VVSFEKLFSLNYSRLVVDVVVVSSSFSYDASWVNFIIILREAFMPADPGSAKKIVKFLVFLCFRDLPAQKLLIER